MDKQNPAEVEDFTDGAGMTSGEKKDGAITTQGNKSLKRKHGRGGSPLFAAAVNSRRLLRWRLEDGFEDGDVLLEDDG